MESLEDDGFVSDWDITKSHCLGPIPSSVLMGPPTIPDVKVPNKLPEAQESSIFQTQSPVSVLESSGGSCSSGKSAVPVRARSKRLKRASSWLSPSTYFITDKQIPIPRKDNKDKKKKLPPGPAVENSLRAPSCPAVTKRCAHCQVTKTPQWREGPLGPKTLCNACGVRYRSGRLFPEYRPAASPTFVPALHSNSHKKVVEMRSKGKELMVKTEEPPASPQPEFVPMSNYLFDYIY
ncbi:gata transcription factor 11 [Phtheirospermum japonicum]|uniref:Gata transcription factor 11 n=1 Tax=Phtheirospermum japonicum TaxID=374723 RepID=A0A830BHK1_9LAMI|nr:gata transcription factor 11 [Phtheirospermum japonicum]